MMGLWGLGASPAAADATSGVCPSGQHLGSYSHSENAYNWAGEHIYKVTVRKRWCYSYENHKVTSVFWPRPSVSIYNEFSSSWDYEIVDHDGYYTSTGADGRTHSSYPQWGHVSWWKVKLCHNVIGQLGCLQTDYLKMGIISYSDGSKKLVD